MFDLRHSLAREIGFRRIANAKRALVHWLPSPLLKIIDHRPIKFLPQQYREKRIIFIHIPKSAGTSIASEIYGQSMSHHTALYFKKIDPDFWRSTYSFAVVRNPYSRLRSAYSFLRSGGTLEVPVEKPNLYQLPEFMSFNSFVQKWLLPNFPRITDYDYTLWPQHFFVCDSETNILVDDVFYLERLHELEDALIKSGFLSNSLPHKNRTNSLNMLSDPDDEHTRGIIYDLYKQDFQLFGYPY